MHSDFSLLIMRRLSIAIAVAVCAFFFPTPSVARNHIAYDIDRAREICDSLPLEDPEGIWIYPEDNVTVLVMKDRQVSSSSLPSYTISVVETTDCSLKPGDIIGRLHASPSKTKYSLELFTERKNNILSKPKKCLAEISDNGETIILKRDKSGFRIRFSFNPSTLLPRLWKSVLRVNSSKSNSSSSNEPPVGMVKIYPSYDGNGSSRRSVRYL